MLSFTMNKNKRHDSVIDVLRTLSILAVIVIHTTTKTLEISGYNLQKLSYVLFINQSARFAVPLFFIISGFVLELNFHLNENYVTFFKKRVNKILTPYLFWTIVYYFFVYYKDRNPNFLSVILQGDASYQLYFIPALLIFYLVFPLMHRYFKFVRNIFVMVLLLTVQMFLLYFDYNIYTLPIYYPLRIVLLNYFPFILGIYIANKYDTFKMIIEKWKYIFISGMVFLMYFVFHQGLIGYLTTHDYLKFYSQWRPSVLLYTIFLGGFLYWIFNKNIINLNIFKKISQLSFFVFFIHVIVLELLFYLFPQIVQWNSIYFILVVMISFTLAYLIHKIPFLNRITG